MSLRGPNDDQDLGKDGKTGLDMDPEGPREIHLPEPRALLERWDRTWNTTEGRTACDWGTWMTL